MTRDVDELLAVVAELFRSSAAKLTLMGGLGVHLRTRTTDPLVAPSDMVARPEALAGITRPTKDIDLCVPNDQRAGFEELLCVRGFEADARQRFRYRRGDVVVDVLRFERARFSGLVLVEGMSSVVVVGEHSIAVATEVVLVATKCNAYFDRRRDGDLVDVARLALADFHSLRLPAILCDRLREVEPLWEVFKAALDAFATPSSAGPDAYVRALLDMPLIDQDEWLSHEVELREVVALSVQRMFARCPMSEDDQ
jgi:hypothetical protein